MSQANDHLGVLLTAYADGSLPEEGCAFIEQQLEAHPELRDRLGEIRATQETLRASLPAAPEALSADRVAAIMVQAQRRPAPAFNRWRPLILLAAACFVVALLAAIATPNLLESRVTATAARDRARGYFGGQVIEQLNSGGYDESPPVRVTSIPPPPLASAPAPAALRRDVGDVVGLDGMAKSDQPSPVEILDLPAEEAGENDTPLTKGREEAVSDTEMGGQGAFVVIGAAGGRKSRVNRPGDEREALAAAKDAAESAPMAVAGLPGKPSSITVKPAVKLAEVQDDLNQLKSRTDSVARSDRGRITGAKADGSGGVAYQAQAKERKREASAAVAETRQKFPKVYDALADEKKPQGGASATSPQPSIAAQEPAGPKQKSYAFTESGRNQRSERLDKDGQSLQQLEQLERGPTVLSFQTRSQPELNGLLSDRADIAQRQGLGNLTGSLLDLLPIDDGDGVPFRLLVDANLPVRPTPVTGPTTRGSLVLNLCTANGLQVVPMPGGFEVQAMRRPLDPTATFGWSREDLRTAFGSAPMQPVAEDAQQTFAIDASTSSFSAAQAALAAGRLPDPSQIEPQHLYNAVPADYPAPTGDDAFQILAEAGPSPFASGPLASRTALVAVGVVSRRAAEGERVPLDLVVALDASGSMGRPAGLARARAGLAALLPQLDARDRIAVVAFGDVARVVQPALRGDQQQRLSVALDSVQPAGATNLADGLALACQVAGELATPGRTCRVLLATDGAALAGDAAPAAEAAVARWRGRGVSLLVVGCADEQYDGAALERLAQKGDGEHLVAASDQQARELFTGRLLPARLAILARDAKAQVTWNPDRVAHARLIGFEKRRLTHQQFRDNTVDAGELAQDAQATALFEIVLHDRGSGPLGTAAVRYHDTRLDRVVELSRPLPGGLVAATASPRLRLFACAAEFGELMQAGWWRNVRGPSDRLAAELARLDQPFAQVLAGMERRFRDLERQDAKP